MIIRKLRMVNFRGFRDKTIDFNDKSVVLLSAANGIGKTTTIDAIEWCLTGEIGRLKQRLIIGVQMNLIENKIQMGY